MEVRPLTPEQRDAWDGLASQYEDAWFWHSTDWLDFVLELGRARSARNLSFSITQNGEVLALCPVLVEEVDGRRQFSYQGNFISFPALQPNLAERKRLEVIKAWVANLRSLATEHDVSYVRVMTSVLAPSRLGVQLPVVDPLLRLGFLDVSTATQVVNLSATEERLWSDMRKGHKSDIKRAEATCEVMVWDASTVTDEVFREYQALHRKDAGRVTRSQHSFDLMLNWIRRGRAILVQARHDGHSVAFALIILFGSGAYYGSSCRDPDQMSVPAAHLLQWRTMLWLRAHNFRHYELGLQHFGSQWHRVVSPKEVSIAAFKRGFGGQTLRVPMAEYFYSHSTLEERMTERMRTFIASQTVPR